MASGGVTYKPKNKKRYTTHGFLSRMETAGGKKIIQNRRRKGRVKLSVSDEKKSLVKRMQTVKSSKAKVLKKLSKKK